MSTRNLLMVSPNDRMYVDDVFSTYTYNGNSSTQTINNGIDLVSNGGMVWSKKRSQTQNNYLADSARGPQNILSSNLTNPNVNNSNVYSSFNSNGYSLGSIELNDSAQTYVSWTFRKAPKFFDVVTYTGNGVSGRQIPHALGIAPGMVVIKRTDNTDNTGDWTVWHQNLTGSYPSSQNYLQLNTASGQLTAAQPFSAAPNPAAVTLSPSISSNSNGASYVAYLFAHDTGTDGIIQCGSFTTDAACNATVTLGWEPQFVIVKNVSGDGAWFMVDSMRGLPSEPSTSPRLAANFADAEFTTASTVWPSATGFYTNSNSTSLASSSTYIYIAIRRPNKPPTSGTQVYKAIARTGTGAAATVTGVGFAPDLVISGDRTSPYGHGVCDRLRGPMINLCSWDTNAEASDTQGITAFNMDGVSLGDGSTHLGNFNYNAEDYISHFFRRTPGVFDVVAWTRTAALVATLNHGLGVVPELIIKRCRSDNGGHWHVTANVAPYDYPYELFLNLSNQISGPWGSRYWNAAPTATTFDVNMQYDGSSSGDTFIAYLFATKAGISKVGSFTGNGSNQTINCGFTTGARFVLIKRTDSGGDWYVWDTARGIVSANDPHLSLNTSDTEVTTDDSVDPNSIGFAVNQVAATNINVNGATYIYLAFA